MKSIVIQNHLRFFELTASGSTALYSTGEVISAGTYLLVGEVEEKEFDHRSQRVLPVIWSQLGSQRKVYVLESEYKNALM